MVLLTVFLIGAGFSACFVVYASAIVEVFGIELFTRLYPLCFLSYGLAALLGPPLGGWIADSTGSYASGVWTSVILIGIAFTIIFFGSKKYFPQKKTASPAVQQ